jgi:hypothetical protein
VETDDTRDGRPLKVELGKIACLGIEGLGRDFQGAIGKAVDHYLDALGSSRREPPAVPRFGREGGATAPRIAVDVPVDPRTESTLRQEASRQGVTVDCLARHSVLVYLAKLDPRG